jgi:hypothetical protein
MRRILPLLLCVTAVLMAAGTWVSDFTPQGTERHPAFGALDKPKSIGEAPKILKNYGYGDRSAINDVVLSARRSHGSVVELAPNNDPVDAADSILYDGVNYQGIGLTSGGTFYTAVRFTPQVNCTLTAIKIYQSTGAVTTPSSFFVWANNGGVPGTVLESIGNVTSSPSTWIIKTATKRGFASGTDFFLGAKWTHAAGQYPAGADAGPTVATREYIATTPGTWIPMPLTGNWNCRALVNTVLLDPDMMALSVDGLTSPEQPNQWLTMKLTVKNVGTTTRPAGIPVKLAITGPSAYTYSDVDQVTLTSLAPGATEQITFAPNWRTPNVLGAYSIKAYTDLSGDVNRANDTARYTLTVTNWLTYADWSVGYWITWGGPKRATIFDATDFGVSYPFTVESLKHEFFHHASYPWGADSTFRFKIYGNDYTSLLYTSPVLKCTCAYGASKIVKFRIPSPITITSGQFLVAICPVNTTTGNPSSLADQTFRNRSIVGDTTSGAWYWWDMGEYHTACFVNWTAPATDVGFTKVVIPWMIVEPSTPVTPKGTITNFGTSNQAAVPCSVFVEDTVGVIYRGYASVSCNAGDTTQVTFNPTWTPPAPNNYYGVTMQTYLAADANHANDGWFHDFFGFHVQDPLTASATSAAPTIDGAINTPEWADANRYDISNVMGWNDASYRYFPGNAWLYLKHDANYLYMAYDMAYQTDDDSAELGIYFDDNNNGVWEADSSEGNYFAIHRPPAADSIFFRRIRPGPATNPKLAVGSMSRTGMTSGHQQYEIKIPIGAPKCSLDVNPNGDTCGLWTFFMDEQTAQWKAYWKTTLDPANAFIPSFYGKLVIAPGTRPDVGVKAITSPTGANDTTVAITPRAWFKNYGTVAASFTGYFRMLDAGALEVYSQNTSLNLAPNDSLQFTFPAWAKPHTPGAYSTRCSTYCVGDTHAINNLATGAFTVQAPGSGDTGWKAMTPVPGGPKGKNPKDGACMAYASEHDSDYVYLLKGNGRYEFYRFNTEANAWQNRDSIPAIGRAGKKKAVKKGATMAACAAADKIYAAKGNNTIEWWQYDPNAPTGTFPWSQMADVPAGAKNVKEGTGAAAVQRGDTNFIYLLKGAGTTEFYRFNTGANAWESRASAPAGASGKSYKNGSALCANESNSKLYAVKGSYNEFSEYDIATDVWTAKTGLPLIGASGKKKKVKDGAGLAYHGGYVYAVKGGNTVEFWKFMADSNTWTESGSIPAGSGKNVKGGGAIVYAPSQVALYVTKGNNTPDFFRYGLAFDFAVTATPAQPNATGTASSLTTYELAASPNPFTGVLAISYALPKPGDVSLRVFDVSGKLVTTLYQGYAGAGRYTARLDGNRLARGIYLLKFTSSGYTSTSKLILE